MGSEILQRLSEMAKRAWKARKNAYALKTKTGAAVLTEDDTIVAGCNMEHQFRCPPSIHAEVATLSRMVSLGYTKIKAIIVVAERDFFTPCGGCMDWIIQFGGSDCIVGFQNKPDGEIKTWTAKELMPYYPY